MRTRTLVAVLGSAALVLAVAGVVLYRRGVSPCASSVSDVPPSARERVARALASSGITALSEPSWAGASPRWAAPGRYLIFFAGQMEEKTADVFSAEVHVDSGGQVTSVGRPWALVRTPAGDESAPVISGGWLAYATRVGGLYQSVACVALRDLKRSDVYVFAVPPEHVDLAWSAPCAGSSPHLFVASAAGGEAIGASIDPAARQVVEGASVLSYTPAVKGELSWLPNLVSRVRELPGVGPEKIAFLENIVFTVRDWFTRLVHSVRPQRTPTPEATLTGTVTPPAPTLTSTLPARPPTAAAVTGTAPPTFTRTATATSTSSPTPAGKPLAYGVTHLDQIAPDPRRPYANVEIIAIDAGLLQLKMIPGTHEPRPSTGLVGSGVIPRGDWPSLVAAFNGGFAAMHGSYGMMVDRKVYLPARDGVATVAVYQDGSIRMGTWGRDFVQTPDMVSFRQNCPPLIENGTITAETGKLALWGLSVSNELYLYRSGLGVTRDGRLLYVAGKPLSAYTLARAMQMAGAVYAMQLDVDEFHVAFMTYDVQAGEDGSPLVTARKLRDDMHGFEGSFLRPFQLDFFYLVRRPQPVERPVRAVGGPQRTATPATPSPVDLPGQIAFASNRDGRWQLYAARPGQPASVRRLLDSPADDLYPEWSPDGSRIAFASRRSGDSEIYVLDVASGSVRQVTHQPSEEWAPSWSPDGARLAYQSDRNGQSDIYVSSLDGSGEKRLTPMEGNHEAPHWSPDGRQIVFDSDLDVQELVSNSINLYVMSSDGTDHRRIYPFAESPVWSPSGNSIAFSARQVYWQVFVLNLDGSGIRQLTTGEYDARYPTWSPDGRWVAFSAKEEGHWQIYAIASAGGRPVRLTYGAADDSYPSWGR